jgi:hypothetical protein
MMGANVRVPEARQADAMIGGPDDDEIRGDHEALRVVVERAKYTGAVNAVLCIHAFLMLVQFSMVHTVCFAPFLAITPSEETDEARDSRLKMIHDTVAFTTCSCCIVVFFQTCIHSLRLPYELKSVYQRQQLLRIDRLALLYMITYLLYAFLTEWMTHCSPLWWAINGLLCVASFDLYTYSLCEWTLRTLVDPGRSPLDGLRQP